jgi:hypothetical protein
MRAEDPLDEHVRAHILARLDHELLDIGRDGAIVLAEQIRRWDGLPSGAGGADVERREGVAVQFGFPVGGVGGWEVVVECSDGIAE